MNKLNTKKVIMIISMFLFIVTSGLIITMSKIDKQTEMTTTLYTAKVSRIEIIGTDENMYCEIHTQEYDTTLHISTNIIKNVNEDFLKTIKEGQMISFRIENAKVEQMNKVRFINIVSLKTDTREVFSLEDYNRYINKALLPTRITGVIFLLIFLTTSVCSYIRVRKKSL